MGFLVGAVALCWCRVGVAAWRSPDDRPTEYQVKAAFLFNFAKFVEWPGEALSPGAPMAICVLGDDPFGEALDAITKGERVDGRDITIRRLRAATDARTCHVLFVSTSERGGVAAILEQLRGSNVLTVSDIDDFTRAGGMIRFTKLNYRIGFEISPQAADRAKLRISSKLLSLATIVDAARTRFPGAP